MARTAKAVVERAVKVCIARAGIGSIGKECLGGLGTLRRRSVRQLGMGVVGNGSQRNGTECKGSKGLRCNEVEGNGQHWQQGIALLRTGMVRTGSIGWDREGSRGSGMEWQGRDGQKWRVEHSIGDEWRGTSWQQRIGGACAGGTGEVGSDGKRRRVADGWGSDWNAAAA